MYQIIVARIIDANFNENKTNFNKTV